MNFDLKYENLKSVNNRNHIRGSTELYVDHKLKPRQKFVASNLFQSEKVDSNKVLIDRS